MPSSKPIAVVDIGSNSVRLVIFDGLKRVPMVLFNEKVLCGLAKNINKTKLLNKEGVKKAESAIIRFIKLAKIMGSQNINLFATSAVRDAQDGKQFVNNLINICDIDVEIFSGEDEAKYAGLGIISTISSPIGVVGDLGGGSLELIDVDIDTIGHCASFPLGPLRMPDIKTKKSKIQKLLHKYLDSFPLEESLYNKSFYAVGGAFRNLAKVHMHRKNYPLKVISNYNVTTEDFLTTIKLVSHMSEMALFKIPGISRKRLSFLPYAAFLMEHIIAIGNPKDIVFAASGIREGFIFSQLSEKLQRQDPLIAGSIGTMKKISRDSQYGYELADWMSPLFVDETQYDQRLRLSACIMGEISCYENTEYRAELAYKKVLDSSLTGLNHPDRVFIAKSLYCRYSNNLDESILSAMQSLLGSDRLYKAQVIGSAMRLGRSLSCSTSGVLNKSKIILSDNTITLQIPENYKDLIGESVNKRMRQLADVVGVDTHQIQYNN